MGTGSLTVRAASGAVALALLDARWDDLLSAQPVPNPSVSATWLRHAASWPGEGPPMVIVAEAGAELVAGGAFWLRPLTRHGGPPVAVFLGDRRPALSPDLLVHPDRPAAGRAVLSRLLAEACGFQPGPVRAEGPTARALVSVAPWSRWKEETIGGWRVGLPHDRIGRRRREVRYEFRRAEKARVAPTVRLATGEDVAEAFEHLITLHRKQWSDRPDDVSLFSSTAARRDWYRRAVLGMAEKGTRLSPRPARTASRWPLLSCCCMAAVRCFTPSPCPKTGCSAGRGTLRCSRRSRAPQRPAPRPSSSVVERGPTKTDFTPIPRRM